MAKAKGTPLRKFSFRNMKSSSSPLSENPTVETENVLYQDIKQEPRNEEFINQKNHEELGRCQEAENVPILARHHGTYPNPIQEAGYVHEKYQQSGFSRPQLHVNANEASRYRNNNFCQMSRERNGESLEFNYDIRNCGGFARSAYGFDHGFHSYHNRTNPHHGAKFGFYQSELILNFVAYSVVIIQ